jgi:phosphoribosylformylglycinamidine cyclo-ligase
MSENSLSYGDSGVDINSANSFINSIKPLAKKTVRREVLTEIGGFGAMFELPLNKYKNPVLVSGTDGVGTKIELACKVNMHHSIGIDLVAMCVNDIIVSGAEPLFFLDYYSTGNLNTLQATSIMKGISLACIEAGCSFVGGETAEMPGMYINDRYDAAGFCVGIVEKSNIITKDKVKSGDRLIAISSSGIHSNGYSLVRKILEMKNISLDIPFLNSTLKDHLLKPTRIYVKSVTEVVKEFDVHAISHITGGGLTENIPRVLPDYTQANIDLCSWELPEIFIWLQKLGNINLLEMLRTFNCGVGMVLCISKDDVSNVLSLLKRLGENAWEIGHIVKGKELSPSVSYV